MELLEYLQYGFIQRALLCGSFIALLCSTLGVILVLRRFSLIGDGLAHVTFGSVALGLFFRVYPLYVSIPLVMLCSLGILKLTQRARLYGDAAIGVVSSFGIAGGVLLASVAGGFNVDLFSYLFGNILAIGQGEMYISVALSIVVLAVILLLLQRYLFDDLRRGVRPCLRHRHGEAQHDPGSSDRRHGRPVHERRGDHAHLGPAHPAGRHGPAACEGLQRRHADLGLRGPRFRRGAGSSSLWP